ncbi:MAG: type II toxin-antitoxin system antitoxin SocA domain-containing protein [Mariniphaga sp.]
MSTELTQKQIGERITILRKAKGLSQENLAKSINLSRPSLAQIELGNRCLDVLELQRLSMVLGFSLDDFMSENFAVKQEKDSQIEPKSTTERISAPTLNPNKLKNVLLYLIGRCAGKPNVGETVLYKLLYFCDFNYYELYEEHLTGATYRKLPFGPVPNKIDSLLGQMMENGQIQRVKTEYYGKTQSRYIPLVKADLTQLKASEKEVIDRVFEQMSDWTATTISDYSHKDLPWEVADDGKAISYELVFYRENPYSVRVYDENEN